VDLKEFVSDDLALKEKCKCFWISVSIRSDCEEYF